MSASQPESFKNYTRRCLLIFVAIVCGTGLMVAASFASVASTVRIALILAIAVFNAGLVSGFLMHLISERKMVYTVLIFTAIFFIGLMGLTIFAHSDVPHLKGS
jgi:cytochrome c oxidase subunit IV